MFFVFVTVIEVARIWLPFSLICFREEGFDWPPIKSILRSKLVEKQKDEKHRPSLFVKVYMEGIPIGRKLNLLAHHSYDGLVKALCHMFRTIILCKHSFQTLIKFMSFFLHQHNLRSNFISGPNSQPLNCRNYHVLTYEDQEGDWMMVGDVPWE